MFDDLKRSALEAVLSRLLLLINHIVRAEPQAVERLRPHAGKRVAVHLVDWPLPLPSSVTLEITPAGMFDIGESRVNGVIDLTVSIQAGRPVSLLTDSLAGVMPHIDLAGDALLASDVNWLAENLRWDVEDDLSRLMGPSMASQITTIASSAAQGLRSAVLALARSGLVPEHSERRARAESPPR